VFPPIHSGVKLNTESLRQPIRFTFVALMTVVLVVSLLPAAVVASEMEGGAEEESALVREAPAWAPGNLGRALWFWPEGERIYQLTNAPVSPDGQNDSVNVLKAYDAQTLEQVAAAELRPRAWGDLGGANEYFSGAGRHHLATVDRDQGRVFVAYATSAWATANGHHPSGDPPCPGSGGPGNQGCVGGLHVLDGHSLEPLGRMPLLLPTAESPRVEPVPRALQYAPAEPEMGWGPRVLMVVEEVANGPTEGSAVPGLLVATQNAVARRNSANIAYAVQFNPETMRQEWAVRLEGCRNSREPRGWAKSPEGHPTAVFRSGGAAPALYVGCHGNAAQQGVVVRVPLDADGVPATMPVQLQLDQSPDPEAESAPPVAAAPRQEAFLGPEKVDVVMADPVSRRILMRVNDAGEVWWVFDGHANQFIGTVGIGDYKHGHTTYGLDPDVGRLYVLAADPLDTTAPGGLYVADMRRNPLPQALHYPHLADPPRTGQGLNSAGASDVGRAMSVMPRANGDVARIFQTTEPDYGGGENPVFRVLVDESPVSVDAPPQDPVVRTLDIDEVEGVTNATFDGTARGFGFRTILLGGAEGAGRVGPADPLGWARGAYELDGYDHEVELGGTYQSVRDFRVDPRFPKPLDIIRAPEPVREFGVPLEEDAPPPYFVGIGGTGDLVRSVAPAPDPCSDAQREMIVAFVGPESPAVVDASSARGEAQPVLADVRTRQDAEAPVSRCAPKDWQALWQTALVSQPPMDEPGVEWPFKDAKSSCTATDEPTGDSWNEPVTGAFASEVECGEDEVQGWGQARGVNLDGVSVARTLSSFRIYRDAERGMVARVESIARGIDIGGIVKIDTVRGVAESWANGRSAPEPEGEEPAADEFNPFNCDTSRPAGTCFQRHIFGVAVSDGRGGTAYKCGPCGPEDDFIEAMNRAFGAYASARFREPNRELARGSDDGYIAAITKKDKERFSDIVLNADLLETMVPMLEVIRYAPHNRQHSSVPPWFSMGTPPRGRQVFQFAAVEVSSTYSVQCLLVYDEESNTCGAAPEELGSLTVKLTDPEGAPLAGGAFEVRADTDADGVVGLVDTLLPDGACVTGEDGTGTCHFEGLQPGSYLVSQVAAPPGYSAVAEPWVSEVGPGEARTVTFTNASNISVIEISAEGEDGEPLSGASFAVYPDPDADGKVAADAQPVAQCTTDESGACSMQVPAGSYVLVQTAAPAGLEPIEPVAFALTSGGQVAAVGIVNYPPLAQGEGDGEAVAAPPPAPGPVYTDPPALSPPFESVDVAPPPAIVDEAVRPPISEQIGGTVVQVIRAPGDALRLLTREPKQAVAWTASILLFALALMAVRRRQAALALISE
jgi:hypothetical protein